MLKRKKRYSAVLLTSLMVFFSSGCESSNSSEILTKEKEEVMDSSNLSSYTEKESIQNEENYYFFNEANKTKKLTLNLHFDYESNPISKVILYHNGNVISDRVKVIDTNIHDGGLFTIEILEYVPYFNEIKLLTHQGEELYLKTGLYNFEKINIINNIPMSERWQVNDYFTGEDIAKFSFESTFTRAQETNKVNYEIILPELSISELLIKESHDIKEESNLLNFTLNIESQKKFDSVSSYEILIVQKNDKNENYIMTSIMPVINPHN